MSVTIRRFDASDDAAVAAYVRVRNEVTPDSPMSAERVAWAEATYPGDAHLLLAYRGGGALGEAGGEAVGGTGAEALGEAVGAAVAGRIHMHGPGFPRYWLGLWVIPEARRAGTGSALLAVLSDATRAAGKTGFQTMLSEAHPEGLSFLAARGFVEIERMRQVSLDLRGLAAPAVAPPPGIALVTLAERPDLVAAVHEVAVETFPDMPVGGEPMDAGTLDEFVAREVERPGVLGEAFQVASDVGSGETVGYASLVIAPGSTTMAYHAMTAVRPAYRGRGIATALKRATIAWAIGRGLETLETSNDEHNAAMRAVNAALGYLPMPDLVGLQGPLTPPR